MIWTLLGTATVAMVISLAAYVSAFESTTINVTSFVKQSIVTGKTFVAADNDDEVEPIDLRPHLVDPDVVPIDTQVCWDVDITVGNEEATEWWYQVVLRDKFSAEMTDPQLVLEGPPVEIRYMNPSRGKGKHKKEEAGAIEIVWWVDYNRTILPSAFPELDLDDEIDLRLDNKDKWVIDDSDGNFKTPAPGSHGLGPGMSANILVNVCTGPNGSGKQEYTSVGCYDFNSGLTVKYLVSDVQLPEVDEFMTPPELELHQMSFDGNLLKVYAADGATFNPGDELPGAEVPGDEFVGRIDDCISPNP